MNNTHLEALQVIQKLHVRLNESDTDEVDVSVHPPFTCLRTLQTVIDADRIPVALGAQDVHAEVKGAFTGDVSAAMLAKLAVSYVIVGHSERRAGHGESSELVCAKAKAVLANAMTPIVCVGETLDQRESGSADEVVQSQIEGSLEGIGAEDVAKLVVAYEPIWAIGTGRTASVKDAQTMCELIRGVVLEKFGTPASDGIRIQYGGSVNPTNAQELLAQTDIDGALVGGASLEADDFARIVSSAN